MFSPHVIGGFAGVDDDGVVRESLLDLYNSTTTTSSAIYYLPDGSTVLWQSSLVNDTWQCDEITLVDFSAMLFGLATMEEFCGTQLFDSYTCGRAGGSE